MRLMTDFVEFAPESHGTPTESVRVRVAVQGDAGALARVMSARGGSAQDHIETARRFIERLPVLFLAESDDSEAIGWSGVQRYPLQPNTDPVWLLSGLTVVPSWRRQGVAMTLLTHVIAGVAALEPGASLHSVINAQNRASIALHERAGFTEAERGPRFAGITFTGGTGVLLERTPSIPRIELDSGEAVGDQSVQ